MNQKNGLGVASLVLGILGFLTAFLVIGLLLDVIAIILGIAAIASKKQKSGLGIAGLVIAGVSIILMIFVGNVFSSDEEKTEITTESVVGQDPVINLTGENSDAETESDDIEEETSTSAESISEQVLLEYEGLTITAKEVVTDSFMGDGIKLLIENDSDRDYGVGCDALIINNYMVYDLFSSTIASGKKANETMYISSSQLEAAGISNIGQIEIYFKIFDPDAYNTLYRADCCTIQTSEFASMDTTAMDDGKELLNQDGVRIVGKYVDENSFWGAAVLLYIENNTGKNISVTCDDMSVNGFMVTPYFSSTVYDSKMCVNDITIMSSDLEENDIDKISDIELKFRVSDADSYSTIFETEPITFSVD